MRKQALRQKILKALQGRPPAGDHFTVSQLAKKFGTSKEQTAKIIFELFREKKLEIYGQLVLPAGRD
ncbi:MAG: hypothetical protein AAB389_00060 [Patescibacteria group bacterium]